tara:strand:+ start:2044 stop:2430 length:387 start_codon:yes stop_codon:yes gene_type:complete
MVCTQGSDAGKSIQGCWWGLQKLMGLRKPQKKLKEWTDDDWGTKSGKPSVQGPDATGERYQPAADHASDSPQQTAADTKVKRKAIAKGEQYGDYETGNPSEDKFLAKHMRMEYAKKPNGRNKYNKRKK